MLKWLSLKTKGTPPTSSNQTPTSQEWDSDCCHLSEPARQVSKGDTNISPVATVTIKRHGKIIFVD